MWKKLVFIMFLIVLMLSVFGCSVPDYQLIKENENYYLMLGQQYFSHDSGQSLSSTEAPAVQFSSISEMKSDIKYATFSDSELENIAKFKKDSDDRIKVCNIDSLYEPKNAVLFTDYYVVWYGEGYNLGFISSTTTITGSLTFAPKEYWQEEIDSYSSAGAWLVDGADFTLISTGYDAERNGTIYEYILDQSYNKWYKLITYTITADDQILHIVEAYDLLESQTVPNSIRILGNTENTYYLAFFSNFETRPSLEQLSQFGIREYVETVTE